jgi:hypothetical protein
MSTTLKPLPEVNDPNSQTDTTSWGTVLCIGTAYGKVIAVFSPKSAPDTHYTVYVPASVENFAIIALERKLIVLASFDGPLAAFVTIPDLTIYNN